MLLSFNICFFFTTEQCPPGYFSYDGFGPECRPCPIGYYTAVSGSSSCTQCALSLSTMNMASNSSQMCVDANALCTGQCVNSTNCRVADNQVVCDCIPGQYSLTHFLKNKYKYR